MVKMARNFVHFWKILNVVKISLSLFLGRSSCCEDIRQISQLNFEILKMKCSSLGKGLPCHEIQRRGRRCSSEKLQFNKLWPWWQTLPYVAYTDMSRWTGYGFQGRVSFCCFAPQAFKRVEDWQWAVNTFGSLYVSGKLPTYPSPISQHFALSENWVLMLA